MKIENNNILLGQNPATKHDAMKLVADQLQQLGLVKAGYVDSMQARDNDITVFLGNGIAIPHGQREDADLVLGSGIVVMPLRTPIQWDSDDSNSATSLVIGIAANSSEHLEILKNISRLLTIHQDKVSLFANNQNANDIISFFNQEEVAVVQKSNKPKKKIVAITACPTGVAHTFMAATALDDFGKANGYEIKVETQGSNGQQNAINTQEVKEADAVIIACDVNVDLGRFGGKKLLKTSTKQAIENTAHCFDEALVSPIFKAGTQSTKKAEKRETGVKGVLQEFRTHLISAVGWMLPFIVAGGVLLAISVMMLGKGAAPSATSPAYIQNIWDMGIAGLTLFIPILGGFIAYSIASRPALAPGMIGTWVINSHFHTGFLGAIIVGFIAGYIVKQLVKIKLPNNLIALGTIFIYPLVGSFLVCAIVFWIIGVPLGALIDGLNHWLNSMSGASKYILSIILGAMTAFDMGGPVNKIATMFAQAQVGTHPYLMGGVGVAICTPPLGMFVATMIGKKLYSNAERQAGKAALIMGAVGITEGAIPFAASDPLRVIPSLMLGAVVGNTLGFYFGCLNHAPWGGFIVVPVVDGRIGYIISILIGSAVTAICVNLLKKFTRKALSED